MARYSKEHKEQTRRSILSAATAAFRDRGILGTRVDEVMRLAGLTTVVLRTLRFQGRTGRRSVRRWRLRCARQAFRRGNTNFARGAYSRAARCLSHDGAAGCRGMYARHARLRDRASAGGSAPPVHACPQPERGATGADHAGRRRRTSTGPDAGAALGHGRSNDVGSRRVRSKPERPDSRSWAARVWGRGEALVGVRSRNFDEPSRIRATPALVRSLAHEGVRPPLAACRARDQFQCS